MRKDFNFINDKPSSVLYVDSVRRMFPGIDVMQGDSVASIIHHSDRYNSKCYIAVNLDLYTNLIKEYVMSNIATIDYLLKSRELIKLENTLKEKLLEARKQRDFETLWDFARFSKTYDEDLGTSIPSILEDNFSAWVLKWMDTASDVLKDRLSRYKYYYEIYDNFWIKSIYKALPDDDVTIIRDLRPSYLQHIYSHRPKDTDFVHEFYTGLSDPVSIRFQQLRHFQRRSSLNEYSEFMNWLLNRDFTVPSFHYPIKLDYDSF